MKMKLTFSLHLIIFLCILINSAHSHGQNFFMPKDVTCNELENGFSYYLLPEDGERGKISIHLLSSVGSLVEQPLDRGVAHFIEHMVFRGSKNYPGKETMRTLDRLGLRIGRDYNASVSSNHTRYYIKLPEHEQDKLKPALLLIKDWVSDLEIDEIAFQMEKKVVIEEINKRKDIVSPYLYGTSLEGHGGLGSLAQINGVTLQQVKAFYNKYYTPDQFALIIRGNVNGMKIKPFIEKIFGGLKNNTNRLERNYIDVTKSTVIDNNYVSASRNKNSPLVLAFKTPSFAVNSQESFKKDLIQNLFTDILENRLMTYPGLHISKLTANRGEIVPGSAMYNFRLQGEEDVSYITLLNDFSKVVTEARKNGFLQEEIDYFIDNYIDRNKLHARGGGKIGHVQVSDHFLNGNMPLTQVHKNKLLHKLKTEITPADFNELLNNFTTYHKTILFDSSSDSYSSNFTDKYLLNRLNSNKTEFENLPKYEFKKSSPGFLLKKKTKPSPIEIEKLPPAVLISKRTLGNGVYELLYENGTAVVVNNSEGVKPQIRLISKNGLKDLSGKDRLVFSKSVDMFNKTMKTYSEEESQRILRGHRLSARSKIDQKNFEFEVSGFQSPDYEEFLKAFNLIISDDKHPNVPNLLEDLRKNKELVKANFTNIDESLVQRLFEYNQFFKTKLEDAYIYVGGDLPTNIDDLISKYIGSIKTVEASYNASEERNKGFKRRKTEYVEEEWGDVQKRASFNFNQKIGDDYELKDRLIAEAIAEYGYHQIFEILRKKHGLIYTLGVTGDGNKQEKTSYVSLRYVADMGNLERNRQVMIEEILVPMGHGKINKENIEICKAKLVNKYSNYFYDDDFLSGTYLKNALEYGRLPALKEISKAIDKISSKQFKRHMSKIIQPRELNNMEE